MLPATRQALVPALRVRCFHMQALTCKRTPQLQASCLDKGGVCIVAALAAGDSAAQAAQLEVLRGAAAGRGDQPLHFSWFAAGSGAPPANAAFSAALGLDAQQAPALVALAPKKQRTAVLTGRFEQVRPCRGARAAAEGTGCCCCRGQLCRAGAAAACLVPPKCDPSSSFSPCPPQDSVKEWLDGLLSGRVRTQPLSALPDFPAAAEGGAGSGGAGEEEAVEDEFSLDEIMKVRASGAPTSSLAHAQPPADAAARQENPSNTCLRSRICAGGGGGERGQGRGPGRAMSDQGGAHGHHVACHSSSSSVLMACPM